MNPPSTPPRGSSWGWLRPRTWKGWTAYGVAALLMVGALAGGEDAAKDKADASDRAQASDVAEQRRELARERRRLVAAERRREQEAALAAAAQPEPAAASCHPSYDPCLDPNASDYDCEGGSGDGPEYTGFVTVTGSDDYDLDSDGDGTGCES